MGTILNKIKLQQVATGAAFLGSGGGGSYRVAENMIDDILEQDYPVELIAVSEVKDSWSGAVVADMGSPDAMLKHPEFGAPTSAVLVMEQWLSASLDFYLPIEVGAINSLTPMTVAARKGVPVVDADGAGRAIPQLEMTTYDQSGIAISPAVLATSALNKHTGVASVILNVPDAEAVETIARPVIASDVFQEIASLACYPLTGAKLCTSVIPGTMTLAMQVGEAIAQAVSTGQDPVAALLALPVLQPTYLLARGKLISNEVKTEDGFDKGTLVLTNVVDKAVVTLHYENESLIALDSENKPLAMAPDSICCITEEGVPLTNADLPVGKKLDGPSIALIGLQARSRLRTRKVEQAFLKVLRLFGYDGCYIPIEKLHDQ